MVACATPGVGTKGIEVSDLLMLKAVFDGLAAKKATEYVTFLLATTNYLLLRENAYSVKGSKGVRFVFAPLPS